MAEKKEVPKSIKEFYSRSQKVDDLIDITEQSHSQVYIDARKKLAEKTKSKSLQALEDAGHRDFFIDALVDSYMNQIKQNEKIAIPKDGFEKDVMLKRYIGVTRAELAETVHKSKSKYGSSQHEGLRDALVGRQRQELSAARISHLKKSDLDDILKHTNTHKMFDKDLINLEHGAILLDAYKSNGEFTYATVDMLKQQSKGKLDLTDYMTKDARKAKKDMRDNYKQAA